MFFTVFCPFKKYDFVVNRMFFFCESREQNEVTVFFLFSTFFCLATIQSKAVIDAAHDQLN